jgi:tRNA threonylcarbamoyl adenosine modification protein YeaZ
MARFPVALALDSATEQLTVACRRADGLVVEREVAGARRHAAQMLPAIDQVLAEAGLTIAALEEVYLSDGPGSFTGLRVGAAVVKGLARVRPLRVATASTLLVRAAAVATPGSTILAIGSAQRGELFVAVYRFTGENGVEIERHPRPIPMARVFEGAPRIDLMVGDVAESVLASASWWGSVPYVGPPRGLPRARALLELAERSHGLEPIESLAEWEPHYGRPAEAQARWEEAHGQPLPPAASYR